MVAAAIVGASGIGGVLSSIFDVLCIDSLNDNNIPVVVPPIVITTLFAGLTGYLANQENDLGDNIIKVLGLSVKGVIDNQINSVQNSIDNQINNVKNIPNTISNSIEMSIGKFIM